MKRIALLGATGSIGASALDVIARHPDRFAVQALSAASRVDALVELCQRFRPHYAVIADGSRAGDLADGLRRHGLPTEALAGPEALDFIAAEPGSDTVIAAIVGAAGLSSTLAAAEAGKTLLLANKEAVVMAGPLLFAALGRSGARLLPIDSEHNAIFQCMGGDQPRGVRRILLTASGGPFLRASAQSLRNVTPEQACAHPRWVMGRKISVDSATLMNKGLELIEACLLFGLAPSRVEVVVHPQSIVHSFVEYLDGSMLAQLGNPDMRTPIAHALGWPDRLISGVESLDIIRTARLDFEAPDVGRFPCLRLARNAAEAGGTSPAVLNAANEVAVEAFLERRLSFVDIPAVIESVMAQHRTQPIGSLDDVLSADEWARQQARAAIAVTGACA